jgi:hypothetical protein
MGKRLLVLIGLMCVPILFSGIAHAVTVTSTHYSETESSFGSGSNNSLSSTSYTGKAEVGDLGVGNYQSASFQVNAGFNTSEQPFLEFVITSSSLNIGYLHTTYATPATASFYVRCWLCSGYSVTNNAPPPTSSPGGHVMAVNGSPSYSTPGTEQFGINLVQNVYSGVNNCPAPPTIGTIGANPVQYNGAIGAPTSNYNTACKFYYSNSYPNNVIAQSTANTSETLYTISYIFNISNSTTPSGVYVYQEQMVATATY